MGVKYRRCKDARLPPFKVSKNLADGLVDQVTDGFRKAIAVGYYRSGDYLPPMDVIAKSLGVSLRIPRESIARLAEENLVKPRPRVGCVVLGRRERVWKGRVLAVAPAATEGSFYVSVLLGEARRNLTEAGYLFDSIVLDYKKRGGFDLVRLDEALGQKYDYAILVYPTKTVASRLVRSGIPFVEFGNPPNGRTGLADVELHLSSAIATGAFVEHCREAGVSSLVVVDFRENGGILSRLQDTGLRLERIDIAWVRSLGYMENVKRLAMEAVLKRFSEGSRKPDAILFTDDYAAFGGLMAIASLGLRIPEDVRVVVWSNIGFAPVCPTGLARFETDPRANGAALADRVLSRLLKKECPAGCDFEVAYVRDASFP